MLKLGGGSALVAAVAAAAAAAAAAAVLWRSPSRRVAGMRAAGVRATTTLLYSSYVGASTAHRGRPFAHVPAPLLAGAVAVAVDGRALLACVLACVLAAAMLPLPVKLLVRTVAEFDVRLCAE